MLTSPPPCPPDPPVTFSWCDATNPWPQRHGASTRGRRTEPKVPGQEGDRWARPWPGVKGLSPCDSGKGVAAACVARERACSKDLADWKEGAWRAGRLFDVASLSVGMRGTSGDLRAGHYRRLRHVHHLAPSVSGVCHPHRVLTATCPPPAKGRVRCCSGSNAFTQRAHGPPNLESGLGGPISALG